jgi:chromate transporter
MAIHIGHEGQGGGTNCRRLLFHSSCGIITGIFAWLYKDYGQLPAIQPFIRYKTIIIAIILGLFFLWQKILKTVQLGIIGVLFYFFRCCSSMKLYFFFGASSWL